MKLTKKHIFSVILLGIFLFSLPIVSFASNYYAVANGNWNSASTWSTSCGGAGGAGVPGSSDNAYICYGITVDIDAASQCKNLILQGCTINFPLNNTLSVNNGLTVNSTNTITGNNNSRILNVSGNLIISSGASLDISGQTVTISGNVQVDGTLTFSNTTGTKTFSSDMTLGSAGILNFTAGETISLSGNLTTNPGSIIDGGATGILNIGGNFQLLSGGTTTIGRNTFTVTGTTLIGGNLTVSSSTGNKTFNNDVTISSTGSVYLTAAETMNINGNLNTSPGCSINGSYTGIINISGTFHALTGGTTTIGQITLTVSGASTIDGTLDFNNTTGNKTFNNDITVNGTWTSSGNESFTIAGNITNNGTFTGGTGTYTLTGTAKSFSGTSGTATIGRVTINSPASYTNNLTNLIIDGILGGTGTFTQSSNTSLSISGNCTITNFIATANPNTVVYNGAAGQTVNGTTYHHLICSTGGTKTLAGDVLINGNFTINSGATFNPVANNFTVSGATTIYGTFGDGSVSGTTNLQNTELNSGTINGGAAGVVNILGNLNITNGDGTIGRVTLTVSGTTTIGTSRTLTVNNTGGTETFNGDFTLQNNAAINFTSAETLTLNGVGTDLILNSGSSIDGTATGIINIGGDLTVNAGGTATIGRSTIDVAGNTFINGTLNISSTLGTETFNNVTISNNWNNSANESITINGNFTNNGTFTAGTGVYTLTGTNKTISGTATSTTFSTLTVNGSYTNNTKIYVTTLNGAGTWSQGVNSFLYIDGNATVANFLAGANVNTVDYTNTGNQTVNAGTYYNMSVSNTNTKTLGGNTTVNNNFTINSGATFNPAGNDFTVNGSTTIYGTFGDGTLAGISNLQNTILNGGIINGSATGVVNILGTLNINSDDGTIGRVALTVSGTTTIGNGKTLTLNNNIGVETFSGAVINNGSWISTSTTTAANLIFRNGITNNGSSFVAGGATFDSNSQTVQGSTALSFANPVTITGINLTNNTTITFSNTAAGTMSGTGNWIQGANSTLNYSGNTITINSLNASASGNTVNYNQNGAQSIYGTTYYHLICSTGGTKTLAGNTSVNGNFIINTGVSFNPDVLNLSVSGPTTIYGTFADGSVVGTSNLQNAELNGGTINGGNTGIVNILGNLNITNGDGTIGRVALTVSGTTTIGSGRTLTLNNNIGIETFSGAVINNGTWLSISTTTPSNLIFRNGITNNGSSFSAGAATFDSNSQTMQGSTALSFANPVTITGINLTNNTTITFSNTAAGTMSGTGNWIQGANSTLNYSGNTITINSLNASASGNTVDYNRSGAQTVFNPTTQYYHINFSSSGIKTLSATTNIMGNLSISGTAVLSAGTFDINLNGNWNNSSTAADPFTEGTRTVTFQGSATQSIINTGNANGTVFNNFAVNNTFPVTAVILNTPVSVNGNLNLLNGHIITTSSNLLVLGTSASITLSATPDSSFVKGPMINTYNVSASSVTKTFPVGKGNRMHRADLSLRQTNTVATQYTGEFFNASAAAFGYTLPGTLDRVSGIDYWDISNGGAANVNTAAVTLYYFPEDLVSDPANLRVAKSGSTSNWLDIGGSGTGAPSGTIASTINFTSFSKFAFGNNKGGTNPLPIELLTFSATPINDYIHLGWETATETNNDYFTIEKSKDAENFETVTMVSGAGNSNEPLQYSANDYEPYQGVSYYRLKQTDFDGQFTYSEIVPVNFITGNNMNLVWWQDGTTLNMSINSTYEGSGIIEFYDASGKLVLSNNIALSNSSKNTSLNTEQLKPGFYIVRLAYSSEQKTFKIILR